MLAMAAISLHIFIAWKKFFFQSILQEYTDFDNIVDIVGNDQMGERVGHMFSKLAMVGKLELNMH